MNILFDFITLQDQFVNGGNVFTKIVLLSLLQRKERIFAFYDNKRSIPPDILDVIKKHKIEKFPLQRIESINDFIFCNKIKVFFIGVLQRYSKLPILNFNCRLKVVCHDIVSICSLYNNTIYNDQTFYFLKTTSCLNHLSPIKRKIFKLMYPKNLWKKRVVKNIKNENVFFQYIGKDSKVQFLTVSEYSKNALIYYYNIPEAQIKVFYPPVISEEKNNFSNDSLVKIINGKKYFLLLNADRENKNIKLFLTAWTYFLEYVEEEYYAILVGNIRCSLKNILVLNYIGRNELQILQRNAFCFVYPTLGEGFGYPPLECMKYKVPVAMSNVMSLPEVFKDAACFFSPFYPEDLFRALLQVMKEHDLWTERGYKRYLEIVDRQKRDLNLLLDDICVEAKKQ